jgi:prepilin-type processing-associated H-X9-DG protein
MNGRMNLAKKDVVILISCVGFLIFSLAAVGESGRRRAKEYVCQSNLRQWNVVFHDYVQNNNGQFLTGERGTAFYWPAQLDPVTQSWKTNKTWFCPTALKPMSDGERMDGFTAWGIYTGSSGIGPDGIAGSYALNGYLLDVQNATEMMLEQRRASDFWRTLQVADGARVPVMIEALRFDLWPSYTQAPPVSENTTWSSTEHMARCCINRHDGAVNCLFADGSVRKVGLKELWTLKWHRTFNTEGPWTKAGGVQSDNWPVWMRGFKD